MKFLIKTLVFLPVKKIRTLFGCAAMIVAGATHAVPVAYEFSGTISSLQGNATFSPVPVNVGDTISFAIGLNTTLFNQSSDPSRGVYGDNFSAMGQAGFTSVISSGIKLGSAPVVPMAWFTGSSLVNAGQQVTVHDGSTVNIGGVDKIVEGFEYRALPSTGLDTNVYNAYLRWFNESPLGSNLTGQAGYVPSTSLPATNPIAFPTGLADFGYYYVDPTNYDVPAFFGGTFSVNNFRVITGPVDGTAQPLPGSSSTTPILPPAGSPAPVGDPPAPGTDFVSSFTFTFSDTVVISEVVRWFDPDVAVGYDFEMQSGDPTQFFDSITLATLVGDGLYDLYFWDGAAFVDSGIDLAAGETYHLAPCSNMRKFRIGGIEVAAGLDPADGTAFVTGLSYTQDGNVTLLQTSLIAPASVVPVPAAVWLFGSGLLGLIGFARRKKRAV